MKNILLKLHIASAACLFMFLATGCEDTPDARHIAGDPGNKAYFHPDGVYESKALEFVVTVSSYGAAAPVIYGKFPVRIMKPLDHDIKVKIEMDASFVAVYNEIFNKEYNAFDPADFTISTTTLTIPKGATVSSDEVEVMYSGNPKNLDFSEGDGYVLPIAITGADTPQVAVSSNQGTMYLLAKPDIYDNNLKDVYNVKPSGTAIIDNTWTATSDPNPAPNDGVPANLFTEGTSSVEWSKVIAEGQGVELIVDLGKVYEGLTGIRIRGSHENNNYSAYELFTSETGQENDFFDQSNGTRTPSYRGADRYSVFLTPVDARYVKFVFHGTYAAWLRLYEFWIYQQN